MTQEARPDRRDESPELFGVELRDIRTFLVLAEELHFARAGDRLGITPSRVSQTIKTLEVRIGGQLLERTSRRVRLTPLGLEMLSEVRPAYDRLKMALSAAREMSSGITGIVRLGMYSVALGRPHLIEIIKTFEARHPGSRVVTSDTGVERDQFEWLRRGEMDVLAMRLPINDPTITIGPLLSSEERILAVAVDHPLADRESVDFEDLAPYVVSDIATLPRELMDAFVPPRTPSGAFLKRTNHRSFEGLLHHVALGNVVHPTVASFTDHYRHPGVTSVPIRDLPRSETAVVWLTARTTATIEAFASIVEEIVSNARLTARSDSNADV